ncbi:MAG: histidine kinase dimerization/phospho-acceptor domain-containing protein [bacterium]
MFKQQSIRKKITYGYYAILIILIGLSIFAFIQLQFIEKKVIFGEITSDFFETILEIRRFEKNYFLYQQGIDYHQNQEYVVKAEKLLETNIKGFETIASLQEIREIRDELRRYKQLMADYVRGKRDEGESEIRESGKRIVIMAEGILKTERMSLQAILYYARWFLILSIVALSLTGIIIGQILSRLVVRPLKLLEKSTKELSAGRFERIELKSNDLEVVSLAQAVNKMLKELEVRQSHLVQSERLASLGTLLSGIAHELNNPLSNISTSSEILKEEIEEADISYQKKLISQIEEQTDRARNIVRSLLEFSRDSEFKKESLSLKGLFEETIRFVKGQIPTRVEIDLHIPDDIVILVDKQRIQQAFLNLIKNAIESIPDKGDISIKAQKSVEGDRVNIEISDTGLGISPDTLKKIFDPSLLLRMWVRGLAWGYLLSMRL